jgi:GNAT superfamily N-acetyltransferase
MYTYHEEIPSVKQYNELRECVGWGALDKKAVEHSLPNSVYSILAKYNNKTIAFARVIGDGKLCFYIQEIIVHPDHQRKGIATNFMNYIFKYFNNNAVKRSYIGVFVGKGLVEFYKKYGFWERPTGMMGPGMMQFWNDADFNRHFKST